MSETRETFTGRIDEVHGMLVTLVTDDGTRLRCRPPRDRTTPVVGDRGSAERDVAGDWRLTLEPRERVFSRCWEHGVRPLAAWVDRLVIVSAVEPPPRAGLVDRMVITADPRIDILLVLNKCDLDSGRESGRREFADHVAAGASLFEVSTRSGEGVEALRAAIAEGTSLFVGHSGVGKSSLLNTLVPGLSLATGDVNDATRKGRHTTTVATMHRVAPETWLIDTPGVRAWSLDGLPLESVAIRFPGFHTLPERCHFAGCLHAGEPGCAVHDAVEAGGIPAARFERYLHLKASVEEERTNRRKASFHDQRNRGRRG
jgi:ribosome biogenesis GTPase